MCVDLRHGWMECSHRANDTETQEYSTTFLQHLGIVNTQTRLPASCSCKKDKCVPGNIWEICPAWRRNDFNQYFRHCQETVNLSWELKPGRCKGCQERFDKGETVAKWDGPGPSYDGSGFDPRKDPTPLTGRKASFEKGPSSIFNHDGSSKDRGPSRNFHGQARNADTQQVKRSEAVPVQPKSNSSIKEIARRKTELPKKQEEAEKNRRKEEKRNQEEADKQEAEKRRRKEEKRRQEEADKRVEKQRGSEKKVEKRREPENNTEKRRQAHSTSQTKHQASTSKLPATKSRR